jgi:hypothetical protein
MKNIKEFNTYIENYLYKIYPEETVSHLLSILNLPMYNSNQMYNKIHQLNEYPETQPLFNAIERELPFNDLSPENNLGINSQGNIVAYDC